ncbi:MAG: hypothetical protein PUH88_05465 [Lachnospiraceae bacterium]|nr:hypothetical protein [Lachnospiraceae bacterium]
MRIMIINPDYGMTREEMELRCQMLSKAVGPDVEFYMVRHFRLGKAEFPLIRE